MIHNQQYTKMLIIRIFCAEYFFLHFVAIPEAYKKTKCQQNGGKRSILIISCVMLQS